MVTVDRDEVVRTLETLWLPGAVYELRIIEGGRDQTISGYFDDAERFAAEVAKWSGRVPAVYLTINPVNPDLLARAQNHVKTRARSTTNDADTARRAWLPLDFDADRPAGISSSEAEHTAALLRARDCAKWLIAHGIPRNSIILADSGNGGHLLVRIDLPNDEGAHQLVVACLRAVDFAFGGEGIKVDQKNGNASRVWKVYGTLVCKGDNTTDRPHRLAAMKVVPDALTVAPRVALEVLATLAPREPSRPAGSKQPFELDAFVSRHLAQHVAYEAPWSGGRKIVLRQCPFNPDHTDKSAVLIEHGSGAVSFTCHHNGCAGKGWRELREMLEPRPVRQAPASPPPGHPASSPPVDDASKPRFRLRTVWMSEVTPEEISWLWYRYIPRGKLTLVEGDPAARKSWFVLMLAACLTRGWALPGDTGPCEPQRVLLCAGEDGLADTIHKRLKGMHADFGMVAAETGLINEVEEAALSLNADGIASLCERAEELKPAALLIDPLVAYTPPDVDMNRANEVRGMLKPLTDLAQRLNMAVIGTRHLTKNFVAPTAYRGQGSIDYLAISRSVLRVVIDKNDPVRSIIAPAKSSLAEQGPAWAYRLNDTHEGAEFLWDGEVNESLDELVLPPEDAMHRPQLQEAKDFLSECLFEGPVLGKEVKRQANQAGIAERTLERAKGALGAKTRKDRDSGQWYWYLPTLEDRALPPIITEAVPTNGNLPYRDSDDAEEITF